ncbi:excinuclease ABC subunit C [Cryobacterium zongtaii]|uniref:UvrABC system protein C n=1 Tax=Cryobacterium zongtaii TaxID=1259217 RepID=A0A2S3ZIJ4_9MICO|nr:MULTISPECIES: excinuclease ABC subunit UvrC [Cryobacterium]POH67406.1 excinuclease ABC subunit C [Cryobacterium zongtaii]TFC55651.1 excinuclease ABC subunit UvrC [Cryobacterium sp. TMB3-1-2]TFC72793.1 excinuclease ABC subunit UvrC [Cryobacterium sp. TMB3-15]TFC76299.1 excinuclease ABC subunit UvrC [Cryobacterium sp. TMB3-10]TFD43514.1 excinuclease ABC subunit UvrC [Cryobacterium sp. TMB3-12]
MSDALSYRPKPGEIPTQPGVYRFRDASRRVLYVGKAKNLRARLSNYFAPLSSLHERTRRMVTTATSVEWTTVGTEIEALQLEWTWINEFDPPFNVQFKDDKSYPYLAVTLADEAPRALVTRTSGIKGARYFGPYPKVWAVHETIDLMLKAFPIRTCNNANYKRAMQSGKPCFAGQIGRCFGPCSGKVGIEEHRKIVNEFVSFMGSQDRKLINSLTAQMKDAALAQDYETAARRRDQVKALNAVLEKSAVVLRDNVDIDLFAIEQDELAAAVQLFIVRGGRIRGVRGWVVDKELDLSISELIDSIMQTAYTGDAVPPREIVLPELPDDADALEGWLGEIAHRKVRLVAAQRGEKAALLVTATQNAKQALMLYKTRRSSDFVARSKALEDLQEALGMESAPLRMECYDVSHLGGTNIVASMVVFEDGLPRKDEYRRFGVPESTDDTDSLYRVLTRRLAYLVPDDATPEALPKGGVIAVPANPLDGMIVAEASGADEPAADEADPTAKRAKFRYQPNLLIVDGGQPQVAAAARALRESGVQGITLCGIAKRLEEIWLPDSEYPVILPRNSDALFLIQRIRDEAHRFAITHQRARRKRDINTILGEIPGLGPARIKVLLVHFGSVARLREASVDSIAEIRGIGPALAEGIHRHLRA